MCTGRLYAPAWSTQLNRMRPVVSWPLMAEAQGAAAIPRSHLPLDDDVPRFVNPPIRGAVAHRADDESSARPRGSTSAPPGPVPIPRRPRRWTDPRDPDRGVAREGRHFGARLVGAERQNRRPAAVRRGSRAR